jgi:GTPase
MTHRELVERARAAGLTQCRTAIWRNAQGRMKRCEDAKVEEVRECCEGGLLLWGSVKGYVTVEIIQEYLQHARAKQAVSVADETDRYKSTLNNDIATLSIFVTRRNDGDGWTWDQFTEVFDE